MQHTQQAETSRIAVLDDRGALRLTGEDVENFLQGLVTNSLTLLTTQPALFAALLTPQGKILADFFVARLHDGVLLEAPALLIPDLIKRLTLYRLRAKVTIESLAASHRVLAVWGGSLAVEPPGATVYTDPRLPQLGTRIVVESGASDALIAASGCERSGAAAYHAHRIACCIPDGGRDYAFGDAFPHEAALDQLSGVDFRKGCYVGQEVVSRMEHRGTARTRIAAVEADTPLPATGTTITATDTPLGTLGSTAGPRGLALIRLDRAAKAMAAGSPIMAGTVAVRILIPSWARYRFPDTGAQPETA